jgi:hypothetical protein
VGVAAFFFLLAALPFLVRRQRTIFDVHSRTIIVGKKTYSFDSFAGFEIFRLNYGFIPASTMLRIKLNLPGRSRPYHLVVAQLGPVAKKHTGDKYIQELSFVMGLSKAPN